MVESSTCRGKFNECKDELNSCFKKLQEEHEVFVDNLEKRTEAFFQKIQKLSKTLDLDAAGLGKNNKELTDESDQENVPVKSKRGRKKKTVLAEISENNLQEVKVKKEKISTDNHSETASSLTATMSSISEIAVEEIKKEQVDMPAPSWIPPKKKTKETRTERVSVRSTRTKGKKGNVRDSDIMVQNTSITTISLSDTEDSEESEKAQQKEKKTRSTRTKTKKVKAESDSGTETDTESTRSTRTKTKNKKNEESVENSEVEETRSTRTKTIRKGKKVEEESQKDELEDVPQETRSTRTKTIKKGSKENEEPINVNNNNDKEDAVTELTKPTRTSSKSLAEKNTEEADDDKKTKDVSKALKGVPKPNNKTKAKRNRSNSTDEEANDKKRSKSTSPVHEMEGNATAQTVYEDARSTRGTSREKNEPPLNATYVADASAVARSNPKAPVPPLNATMTIEPTTSNAANCTVVVDKPQFNLFNKKSIDDMLTDDDSIEVKKTPPKKAPTAKASKEVFSPYEKTTLKKKVEAFEKLQSDSEIPLKTSKRSLKDTASAVKEKAKIFTPLGTRFLPSSSSTSKISRLISQQQNCANSSTESLLKTSSAQKECRDRQKKQLEREQAQKKKEAMLLAQAEAKKKLNEEKQLKAQQQRKALEAEKLKQLEVQKQKEAKMKQREQEREAHLQKQKLEVERKRLAQKKKLAELHAQRQQMLEEQARNPPIYMTSKPPRLPTEDCYDSDDPDYRKVNPPNWCKDEYSKRKQLTMLAAGEKIKNTLFCRKPQTPDLLEIFEVIDPRKLKRSSSVLWRKPPRYTMMPDLNETKFEEDDELYSD